jgi:hypothetical protein
MSGYRDAGICCDCNPPSDHAPRAFAPQRGYGVGASESKVTWFRIEYMRDARRGHHTSI